MKTFLQPVRLFLKTSPCIAVATLLAALPTVSFAQSNWNGTGVSGGTGSADINLSTNWTPSGVPTYLNFSSINTAGATALTLSGDLTGGSALANSVATAPTVSAGTSGTATFTVSSAANLAVGQIVTGTGITTGAPVVIKSISGNTVTLSSNLTANTSGAYVFTNSALNFSDANGTAVGELLAINSSSPGTARAVSLSGTILLSQRTLTANTTTLSSDVNLTLTGATTITRIGSDLSSGTLLPSLTINGGLDLGSGGGVGRLTLNGSNLTINGVVSGSGSGITISGAFTGGGSLTLTNAGNSFSGGITDSANPGMNITANSTTVLANTGLNSALGSGGAIQTGGQATLTLMGFSTTQTTDRSITVGAGSSAGITNNGTAAIVLNGSLTALISGATTSRLNLGGSYNNFAAPNQINGVVSDGSAAAILSILNGTATVWSLSNPANSFTGGVSLGNSGGATIIFNSINNAGTNSSVGKSGNLSYGSLGFSGNVANFVYVGAGSSTDRSLNMAVANFGTAGSGAIYANGSGALTFTGTGAINDQVTVTGSGTRTLFLDGFGNGAFSSTSTATVGDNVNGAFTGKFAINKRGSGTWTIAGSGFNYTGGTTVQAGKLILDYTTNAQLTATAPAVTLDGGALTFLAKTSGATSSSLGTLQINSTSYTASKITLDANGGSGGFGLTIATLEGSVNAPTMNLIDISNSASNSVTVTALGTNLKSVNGVLMNNAATAANGRASLIVKDSAGYGFASLSGGTTGTLQKLAPTTALDATNTSNTTNYLLNYAATTAGTLTRTAALDFSTVTVDSTGGAITLAMGANQINATGAGHAIVFSGSNNVTVSGSNATSWGSSAQTIYLSNYLGSGATLNLQNNIGTTGSAAFYLAGDGFTTYSGAGFGAGSASGSFNIYNGIFRVTGTQDISAAGSQFRIGSGAVFEIGADLNGATAGDLTNAIGAASNGKFAFYYDSGLSASGADRLVNFGGAGATITWGSGGFLTTAAGNVDGGFKLMLSSARSDARVEISNAIDLNSNTLYGSRRTVEVAKGSGSAPVDARLSGVISGVSSALVKAGTGTLEVTAANTYAGGTAVSVGTLLVNNSTGSGTGTGAVTVASGAILGGSGTISGAVTVGGSLRPGNSIGTLTVANNVTWDAGNSWVFELGTAATSLLDASTGTGNIQDQLLITSGDFAKGSGSGWTFNFAGGGAQGWYKLVDWTGTTAYVGTDFTATNLGTGLSGSFTVDAGTSALYLNVVPEPATWALLAFSLTTVMVMRRRRQS